MTRYFCHECALEDNDFPTNAEGPVCPRCQGAFVEEIPADESGADDPRDFDPDDDGEERGGGLPFNLFGGGAGGVGGGGPAFFQFVAQPGGGPPIITAGGGGAGAGGAQAGLNPLTMAMLQAFGMAPPPQGVRAPPLRRVQSEGAAEQPRTGQAGDGEGEQVPLRNLAAFLGEAFGGGPRQPHPADDPANNPFAEGGHETPRADDTPQPGSPNAAGPQQPQRDGAAPPNPLNHLLSLLNVFGLNTQVLGGGLGGVGLRANAGDYAWGSEADFQQLLNDLMEQAAGRAGPQPAPDDMIEKLPRLKVSQDLLDMSTIDSCGICLDTFHLSDTAVALPCKHLYHEDCLVPWLKTSGTCPTCRFALVPQPGQPGYEAGGQANAEGAQAGEGGTDGAEDQANATASTSTSTSDQPPRRPSLPSRQNTLNPLSPSTARIPEIAGGSSLPGSWIWPAGEGEGEEGGAMDVDGDPEEVEAGEGEREAGRAAAQAAERRAEEARRREELERMRVEEGDKSLEEPIIEDVD